MSENKPKYYIIIDNVIEYVGGRKTIKPIAKGLCDLMGYGEPIVVDNDTGGQNYIISRKKKKVNKKT